MKPNRRLAFRSLLVIALIFIITIASSRLRASTGTCGGETITLPFTDVSSSNIFFCSIAGAFVSGLTNGTTPTTYSPSDPVPREQMAAFITRTQDSAIRRGKKRAALQQFWTTIPHYTAGFGGLGLTTVGTAPKLVQSDGANLWVANNTSGTVSEVEASTGKLLNTWTGATSAFGVLVAMGRTFVTGNTNPGRLYMIDPTLPGGAAVEVTNNGLGVGPQGVAFDGVNFWTANFGAPGSVSRIFPTAGPWSVSNFTTGFSSPRGILFDGKNIWVTDFAASTLLKLDTSGNIIQTVNVGQGPSFPAFDGTNIWVPNGIDSTVTVVRASTGAVLATLTFGLDNPEQASFDGERIMVTNFGNDSVVLWKATDLTGIISIGFPGFKPFGVCSDGTYFWIALSTGQLGRF